ncbi:MAG: ABC transporter permease [Candidatus Yanofskybacteria bacterium]|nr:ABC transporter permease [Candidatus Yanofskybacteria bacterium]
MNTFRSLVVSSALIFLRSRQALFFTLFMPLVIMFIFGLIGFDKAPTYDIGVVAASAQPATVQFIDRLKEFEMLKVHEGSLADERAALEAGERVVVLVIPGDLIDAAGDAPKEVVVYVNDGQPAQVQSIVSMLSQYLDKTSLALAHAPTFFTLRQERVESRDLKYIDFLLPGLIAMSVMQMSVFSVAFLFVQYKEKGVLKRLAATPMRPFQFVAANAVTRLAVSFVQTAIFILVGVLVLDATVVGSYWLIALCVILGALMFLGLGFTVSGIAKTVESVPALANLIVFPMLFLGGTFFPLSSMPEWLQTGAKLLPLTFFSTPLREVMTKGAGFSAIAGDLLGMVVWGAILIGTATLTFGLQERDSA